MRPGRGRGFEMVWETIFRIEQCFLLLSSTVLHLICATGQSREQDQAPTWEHFFRHKKRRHQRHIIRGDVIMIMHAREELKDRIQLKNTEDAVSLHQFSLLYSTLLPTLWRYFALHIQRRKTRTYRTPKQNSSCLICLPLVSARTQHCSELVLDCHSSWGLRSLSCHSLSLSSCLSSGEFLRGKVVAKHWMAYDNM